MIARAEKKQYVKRNLPLSCVLKKKKEKKAVQCAVLMIIKSFQCLVGSQIENILEIKKNRIFF